MKNSKTVMISGKEVIEDRDRLMSRREFILESLNKFFVAHIPIDSIQDLRGIYLYVFGLFAYVISLGLFFFFLYTSYYSGQAQPYLSLQTGEGCQTESILVTNQFQADYDGNWQGQLGFKYVKALYSLSLNFFNGDQSDFADAMGYFYNQTQYLGKLSHQRNLAMNLVYWMRFYTTAFAANSLVTFQMTGEATSIFNLVNIHAVISGVGGDCTSASLAGFNQANAKFAVEFDYMEYSRSQTCLAAIDPTSFGYRNAVDGGVFALTIDASAFTSAISVNLGVQPLSSMVAIPSSQFYYPFGNFNLTFQEFYDYRSPLMPTILCVLNVTTPQSAVAADQHTKDKLIDTCFVKIGDTYALPVFDHNGLSTFEPKYCDCESGVGNDARCQTFNFLVSLIVYNFNETMKTNSTSLNGNPTFAGGFNRSATQTRQNIPFEVKYLLKLVNSSANYGALNRAAYNASFAASASIYDRAAPIMQTAEWRQTAYDFCTQHLPETGGETSCSLLTFNAFEDTYDYASTYKYPIPNGSCSNTFTIPESAWNELVQNPPASFTQDYFNCTTSNRADLLNSIGIAQNNVQTMLPFLMLVSLPLLYFILRSLGQVPPKEEYSEEDKTEAIESLIIQLLRLRDGKTRGMKSKGVLVALGKELISAAKAEGGYPDSDDEEEEDEDDQESGQQLIVKGADPSGGKVASGDVLRVRSVDRKERNEIQRWGSRLSSTSVESAATGARGRAYTVESSSGGGGSGSRGGGRHKMSVFTKHIQNKPSGHKPSGRADDNSSRPSLIGRVSEARQSFNSSFLTAAGGVSSASALTRRNLLRRATGGGGAGGDTGVSVQMRTLSHDDPEVLVLNSSTMNLDVPMGLPAHDALVGQGLDVVISSLISLMNDAVSAGSSRKRSRETRAYQEARSLSLRLLQFETSDLYSRPDTDIFNLLAHALCMHTSIHKGCGMSEAEATCADTSAYEIGGEVFTLRVLRTVGASSR